MAMDPQEFKKRREARARQRQKQKKRIRLLGIAAAALLAIAVVVLIILLASNAGPQKPPEEENANRTVVHIAAVGDLNVTDKLIASGGENLDYTDTFKDVLPLLADADITLMNLEGNFYGQPYSDRSAPQSLAKALAKAGVDMVQVANSYSIYKGMDGLKKTLSALNAEGLEPLGAYPTSQEAKGYTIRTVQGVKIAFAAFTKGMDGMALPPGSEHCVNVLYTDYESTYQTVDTQRITSILQAVQREAPDITIAMLHWGSEYNNTISTSQEKIVSLMQENGVDAIIGTHSHYVQQMTLDEETGNFVAYSLGDFFGDATRAGSEYSVILDLEITKDNATGKTQITNFSYTPIFTVAQKNTPLRVVRLETAMKAYEDGFLDRVTQQTYEEMAYALERIKARVSGEG